jgi:hypothetical protein
MKVLKFIKLYFFIFPIAVIIGLWTALCTLLEHIINQYKIK